MWILNYLFGNDGSNNSNRNSSRKNESNKGIKNMLTVGKLYKGEVVYINDEKKYLLAKYNETTILIPIYEIADEYIEKISDELHEGQQVEFVTTKEDNKGWKGSIKACQEYYKRQSINTIEEGEIINDPLTIKNITKHHLLLETDGFEIKIPHGELPVWLQELNSVSKVNEYLEEDSLRVKVINKYLQDDWFEVNNRNRNAYVIGQLLDIKAKEHRETLKVTSSIFPFKIKVAARRPRSIDKVLEFVLHELNKGFSKDEIAIATGFSNQTMKEIRQKLEELNYLRNWQLTEYGEDFISILEKEKTLNNNPIIGYFASNAHPSSQIIGLDHFYEEVEYAHDRKQAVVNWKSWLNFQSKTDDEIPFSSLSDIISEDQIELLKDLQTNPNFSLFVRELNKPEKYLKLDTPTGWFYGGLNKVFNPLTDKEADIEPSNTYCSKYLLIKYKGVIESQNEEIKGKDALEKGTRHKWIYYEPNTQTFWAPKSDSLDFEKRKFKNHNFPQVDSDRELVLDNGLVINELQNPIFTLIEIN